MADFDACDACGEPISEALSRTVRLTVDRAQVDEQRLCPECFAEWIDRYQQDMQITETQVIDDDSDIIVD